MKKLQIQGIGGLSKKKLDSVATGIVYRADPDVGDLLVVGRSASILYDSEACEKEIGYVTSAMWSPAVKANIAMAMVKAEHAEGDIWVEIYYAKELRQYRKVVKATVRRKPFWAPERANATPPADF